MSGVVVAGAVTESIDGQRRLLLAQRDYPPDVAGLWELPGGKVEGSETPEQALVRELAEELDITVVPGVPLCERVPLRTRQTQPPLPGLVLIALRAHIADGTPRAVEHRALRWCAADELAALAAAGELVPADTAWLPELLADLRGARVES